MKTTVTRYHDISCGHRVVGHEGKCRNLHGHNYRIHFTVEADQLDEVGRVIDFGVIKAKLCGWLEDAWDHKMLLWVNDPDIARLRQIDSTIEAVPFNPTAENMAEFLLTFAGPALLHGTNTRLIAVRVEETAKCSAEVTL